MADKTLVQIQDLKMYFENRKGWFGKQVEYVKAVAATAMDANDNAFISDSRGDYARTIRIPVSAEIGGRKQKIGATDFGISDEESEALFENGRRAAGEFLAGWDFESWLRTYR